jgi:hypothetical protein
MREQNLSEQDAKHQAYVIWCEHHLSCPKVAFRNIKEVWTPYVRDYVAFFVGVQNCGAYKTAYNNLWANRSTQSDHRFFRPWYDTAYQNVKKKKNYNPESGEQMASISQTHRVKKNIYCNRCEKVHNFEFPLGAILKLIVAEISRDDWGQMVEDKFQVSHLNGIPDDGNYILESSSANNSRKTCHSLINVAADPAKIVCTRHERPCFLAGARMCGRWPNVIAEMMEENRRGHPAINAFDSINYKISS